MTRSFMAYQLQGMAPAEETAPMRDSLTAHIPRPLTFVPHRIDLLRRIVTGEHASAAEMRAAGWQMDYTLDGFGRLFGRWPDGADPVAPFGVDEAA